MLLFFSLFVFHISANVITTNRENSATVYRIQGAVIFPNGTSVYADHELSADPGTIDQKILFSGLFQLAGNVRMAPVVGSSEGDGIGSSYYVEQDQYGAFVYTEGDSSSSSNGKVSATVTEESCTFSFSKPEGKRGQFWLLKTQPCGEERRQTITLEDGRQVHFYGTPALVNL